MPNEKKKQIEKDISDLKKNIDKTEQDIEQSESGQIEARPIQENNDLENKDSDHRKERHIDDSEELDLKNNADNSTSDSVDQENKDSTKSLNNENNSSNKGIRNRENYKKAKEPSKNINKSENSNKKKSLDFEEQLKEKAAREANESKVGKAVNTTVKLKKAAASLASFTATAFKVIIDPITLGLVVIFIIGVAIYSASMSLGTNDYNIMCDVSGTGVVVIDSDADSFTRQSAIASWLTSNTFAGLGNQPMTKEQAAGVIGNMIQESYQANPKAMQGNPEMTEWETCDNDCVLDTYKSQSNKGIGIVQWDGGRRVGLVNFAKEQGTQWHELNTQLKFLKKELDGRKGKDLSLGGFTRTTRSIADYTTIWDEKFEVSDLKSTDKRIAYAESFASKYSGGRGLATNCIGGIGVDTSNLVKLAIESAWPNAQSSNSYGRCSTYKNCGSEFAMPAYIRAKKIAEDSTGADNSPGLLASCDRYVATMYRATGKDPEFPWGNVAIQMDYMENSPKWEKVSCQNRVPGDVVARKGHIMLYLGIVNGVDSTGSASIARVLSTDTARTGAIYGMKCKGDLFFADSDLAQGYRLVK